MDTTWKTSSVCSNDFQWHKQVENLKKPKPKNLKQLFIEGLHEEDLPSDLEDPYE
jgi:hypothetical protein